MREGGKKEGGRRERGRTRRSTVVERKEREKIPFFGVQDKQKGGRQADRLEGKDCS
jgi:hypothetical protein